LSRLVSSTITSSLPNSRIIRELDENIQKYAEKNFDFADCSRVASMIADRTITNLEQLNTLAKESPEKFILQIKNFSKKAKDSEQKKSKRAKEIFEKMRTDFQNELLNRDLEIKAKHEMDILLIKEQHEKNKWLELEEIRNSEKEKFNKERESYERNLREAYGHLKNTWDGFNLTAKTFARVCIGLVLFICILLFVALGILLKHEDWNKIEWITFYILGTPLLSYIIILLYFIFTDKEINLNPKIVVSNIKERRLNKICERMNFDRSYFERLKQELGILEFKSDSTK
jgi:hypothetical protein